jgi:pyrroline-5-carboxylate reductase
MTTIDLATARIGFLGAGQMATALAAGWRNAGCVPAERINAFDVSPAAVERFRTATGGKIVGDAAALLAESDVIFLAIKPQHLSQALGSAAGHWQRRHLAVSIIAGVTLKVLGELVGSQARVIRVMPNTPCLVGAGASAFALGHTATHDDGKLVQALLSTGGIAAEVPERLLDAVTGLSGSGPAYVYLMIEALSDGGVRMGLPRDLATRLAAQTVAGAAQMVLQTGQHPGQLKDAVASPAGTTIAGLHALETGGLRGTLMNAVVAATERARELSAG